MSIRASIQLLIAASLLITSISIDFRTPNFLSAQEDCNPIFVENQNPGTDDWQLTNPTNDRLHHIKGYASKTSVNIGEAIDFHISVDQPQTYMIHIYRMGWYDGLGGRLMREVGPRSGVVQPGMDLDPDTGLITMPWSRSYRLRIPNDWVSGVYVAKLTNQNTFQNYIVFAVRDDSRQADMLYQQAVTTDQAYNNYPDDKITGKSLYVSTSFGEDTLAGDTRAVKVSFDRPYARDGAGLFFEWEHNLIRWLEREGYDLSYSTNIDTHLNGDSLKNYKAFLSGGHDEFWTKEMRDKAEEARDSGVSLAFFGANAAFEQIRFEDPDTRIITAYKNWNLDPSTDPETKTVTWRQINQREEQRLVGIQYISYNSWPDTNMDYIVENSDHWVYEGTGFADGDVVEGIIGYEVDQRFEDVPLPEHLSYDILSTSPYSTSYGTWVDANSSIYQAPSGAWVFATGTLSWSWGLDRLGIENEGLKKTTSNILNRFIGGSHSPCVIEEPTATPTPLPPTATDVPPTATPDPTATPQETPTDVPLPPTDTPVPPTADPTETVAPTPTNTLVPNPDTPTATDVPPTDTPSTGEPTSTPSPDATATDVPSPTPTGTFDGLSNGIVIGRVFDDLNGDGTYEFTEPAVSGITATLIDISTNGQVTTVSVQTNEQGIYSFYDLPDANYRLSFVMPAGYSPEGEIANQISASGVGYIEEPYSELERMYLPFVN